MTEGTISRSRANFLSKAGLPFRLFCGASSGVLYFLSFPGQGEWGLAVVMWLPLLYALRGSTTKQALLIGGVTGFTMNACGFSWLPETLSGFLGASWVASSAILAVLAVLQSGRMMLAALLAATLRSARFPNVIAWPAALVISEMVAPMILPYSDTAILHTVPEAIQVLEWTGRLGPTFLIGAVNAGLWSFLSLLVDSKEHGDAKRLASELLFVVALVGAALTTGIVMIKRVDATTSLGTRATVALVQPNSSPLDKRETPSRLIEEHASLTKLQTAQKRPHFFVWSESVLARPLRSDRLDGDIAQRGLSEMGVAVVTGAVVREAESAHTNSIVVIDERGRVCKSCRYDKQTLVPLTEGTPGGSFGTIVRRFFPAAGTYQRGAMADAIPVLGRMVGGLVCYEALYPNQVRRLVTEDVELLLNLSNDAWFRGGPAAEIHFALAKLRAIEHRKFMLRATSTGISAIVDPVGRVVAQLPSNTRGVLLGEIVWLRGTTFSDRWGDWPWRAYGVVLFLLWSVRRLRGRRLPLFEHEPTQTAAKEPGANRAAS